MTGARSALSVRIRSFIPIASIASLTFVAYYLGATVGLALTPRPQPVSTLWPPNAILLAMLLLAPTRAWPIVLVSAFPAHLAVELRAGVPLSMVLCWFVSNCAEALIGAACTRRLVGDGARFDSVHRVGVFVVFGAVAAPFLSSFLDAAFVRWNGWGAGSYWQVWSARFFSNVLAILTLVPAIVVWGTKGLALVRSISLRRALEASVLVTGLVLVCVAVFAPASWPVNPTPVWFYAPLPLLLWAAVRFGPAGTSACLLIFSLIAIWGAIHARGPFAGVAMGRAVLSLQLFLIIKSVTLLALTALIDERRRAEEAARRNEERLHLALSAAQMGTWNWDIREDRAAWSGTTGADPGREQVVAQSSSHDFLAAVSPDDRPVVQAAVTRAIAHGEPFETEFRVVRMDGTVRWIHGKGTVVRDDAGRPVRMLGVNADVTERRRAETALRNEAMLRESAARLRELADAMPQIVFGANPDGHIDYVNRKWHELTATTDDTTPGARWMSVIHPDDGERYAEAWLASMGAGDPFQHEARFWSAPARCYRWHLVRALPVCDETGGIVRWYGTATDIDDQKRVEEALRERETQLRAFGEELEHRVFERTTELSQANAALREEIQVRLWAEDALRATEERFAKAFRASPDVIVIIRQADGRFIEVNPRWEKLFEYSRDESISRTMDELCVFADRRESRRVARAMATEGFVSDLELDLRSRTGAIIRAVLSAERVEMGNERCVITTIRDITERRRAEREIDVQRRELAHLGRVALLGEMSGALAHEINQPLAAILANARAAQRILQRDPVEMDELRAILDDIVADDRRAGAVIKRVRGLIRKGETEPQLLVANDVVSEVLELAHSDLVQRGVVADTRLSASLPLIHADRVQLQQVVLNLIVNACDAMADTPPADRALVISTSVVGDAVQISVSDQGSGLAPDSLESVFEPFVTSKADGLGLGLAICRSIVGAHGGGMWAANNADRGATFHVRLPADVAAHAAHAAYGASA